MKSQGFWNLGRVWSGVVDEMRSITNIENIAGLADWSSQCSWHGGSRLGELEKLEAVIRKRDTYCDFEGGAVVINKSRQ